MKSIVNSTKLLMPVSLVISTVGLTAIFQRPIAAQFNPQIVPRVDMINGQQNDSPPSYRLTVSRPQDIVFITCPERYVPKLTYLRNVEAIQCQPTTSGILPGTPGQSVQQIVQWASTHRFLPPLQPVRKLDQGYPDYRSVINLGQRPNLSASYISFEIFADSNEIVTDQTIAYVDHSHLRRPLAFTQKNAEGLQLIQQVYSEAVKDDFVRSRYIKTINTGEAGTPQVRVYRGERFVYQVWKDRSVAQLTVSRLEDFNRITQR
ncbi:hypothetical protein [Phormidesmis sp. 146-33]